jgi:hypothetical protein
MAQTAWMTLYSTEASGFLNKIFDEGTSSFYRICK